VLSAWSTLVRANFKDIAVIMTMESGKPLHKSRGDVTYGTSLLDYYAAKAVCVNSARGRTICPTPFAHTRSGTPWGKILMTNKAVGMCRLITPWNFPLP
jgi:succinate-semialdehyde dehydrogenase/glutarate-semialdehyde dehydrogenase